MRTDREYGDSKIEAEELCREFVEKRLEVVILRPTIVYGPFSDLWTVEFAERFRAGTWLLPPEACQGRCNLVYVDDLVRCILLALKTEGIAGRAFNVNGGDDLTWQEYFERLNEALGLPPLPSPGAARSRVSSSLIAPVRALVKATYRRFEATILSVYRRSRIARRLMKRVEQTLRSVPSGSEFDLYGRRVHFPTDLAEQVLGYRPRIDVARGVHLSALWMRHEGGWDTHVG